ncbi:MAG: IS1634 family transposase [Candidatus Sumerlaeota bacterium]|nr:IS1634 family transposase [Candidatus Sumerlaeota bacterium]
MASLVKKIKKGRGYYYAVECKRVDGKPRITWQKYLGTLDGMVERADSVTPPKPKETVIYQTGGVAALARIAQRLGLTEIINAVVPKREQGPSVGEYILLAALNRAIEPCSKLAMGAWYEETVLRRLWGYGAEAFSSQRFWDHMDRIEESHIVQIQERVLASVKTNFGLDSGLLLYDTTNFYTYIATVNDRCHLAQRGCNKQHRNDLRQYGLALLLTRDFQIPVLHQVYDGNITDVSLFPSLMRDLLDRYRKAVASPGDVTLVFDKGNVSAEAMEALIAMGQHFVTAVSASGRRDLLATPMAQLQPLPGLPGTKAFETTEEFWGKPCRAVVAYTESFYTQQLHGLTQSMVKCQKKLLDLAKDIERWISGKTPRRKRPTAASLRKSVNAILSGQFMKEVFDVEITEDAKTQTPRIRYQVNHAGFDQICRDRLGRTLIVSTHADWNARQIVETYRSLSGIEEAFRNMKDVDYLRWQPAYHWTDGKLRVHGLYCVLALLLSCLARKVALQAGVDLPLLALLDELNDIREVAVIYPPQTLGGRKDHITLSRMSPRQKKLAEALQIADILASEG